MVSGIGSGPDCDPPTPDSLVRPDGAESSDYSLSDVLLVLAVAVALLLVLGYVTYGMGPV